MPRSPLALVLAVLGVVAVIGLSAPSLAGAQAKDDDCQVLDTGPIPNPAQAACDAVEGVIDEGPGAVTDVATAPLRAGGDAVMKGVTTWVGNGARWLVEQAGKLIDETTTPRITSDWFSRQYASMAAIAAVFALPLLLLAVCQSVLRRDSSVLVRAALVNLPAAFLLTAIAVTIVDLLLVITDQASAQVASSVGNDADEFFADTGKALGTLIAASGPNPVPLFAVFLAALIAAVGAFFVWIELLLRSAAIYVCVLFLPLTFVAMIWPSTAKWAKRLVELLFAVIVSKFVIVAIMALAAAGLGQSRGEDAFQGVLAGAALMMLAAFSPFVLLRLIPIAEAAVASSSRSRGGAGSQALGQMASPGQVMRRMLDSGGGGGLRAAPAGAGGGGGGAASVAGAGAGAAAGGVAAAGGLAQAARGRAEQLGGAGERADSTNGSGGESPARPSQGNSSDAADATEPRPDGGGTAAGGDGSPSGSPGAGSADGGGPPVGGDAGPRQPGPPVSGAGERPVDPGPSLPRPPDQRGGQGDG